MRAWSLLALCLALAGAAAAAPWRYDTWQMDGVRDFVRQVGPASAGADPFNCKNFSFTQKVDHFDRKSTRTFQQRYYVCDGMWRNRAPGSREPLFAYFGGEQPLDAPYPSIFMDQARDEGGLLLFIEHRYYGKSYPFGPKASYSNEGLRFLTVEQAMADFNAITLAIRKAYNVPSSAKNVGYGGSYTGSVAAYMRLRYPQTFHAVLASSSVVKFLVGTEAWERNKYFSAISIGNSIAEVADTNCQQAVAAAISVLQGPFGRTANGRLQLAAAAGLCPNTSLNGWDELVEGVSNLFELPFWSAFQVMFKKGPSDNAVAGFCSSLAYFPKTPLGVLAAVSNFTRSYIMNGAACITGEDAQKDYGPAFPRPTDTVIDVQYTYQGCFQGFPNSAMLWSAPPSIFGRYSMPTRRLAAWCKRIYGIERPLQPPRGLLFNQWHYKHVGNIIFTSGGIDPWRPGAVLQTLDPTVPALTSAGASHCMDLRQATNNTLATVNVTQAIIKAYIREWVYSPNRHSTK